MNRPPAAARDPRPADAAGGADAAASPPVTHLLYLHGFRSSPRSAKAQVMARWAERHRPDLVWWCPQLPPSPAEAIAQVERGTEGWPAATMAVIGSSLGGFYARVIAARRGCRAALLNPAVEPARDLARHIGEQTSWHGDDRFFFEPRFVDELRALEAASRQPLREGFAVIAKGDEVLDWREMAARCADCTVKLLDGGDHALGDFEAAHLDDVVRALGLSPTR